jgi:21S rRNA (GM2251-2'-O)-methyltransferase
MFKWRTCFQQMMSTATRSHCHYYIAGSRCSSSRRRSVDSTGNFNTTIKGDLLHGTHSIEAALKCQSRKELYSMFVVGDTGDGEDRELRRDQEKAIRGRGRLAKMAEALNVPVYWVSRQELNALLPPYASGGSGGVALDCSPIQQSLTKVTNAIDVNTMCEASPARKHVVVIMDEVQDPQNLGSTLRSALFLGADGVIISGKNSSPLSPSVSKASSGAMEILSSQGRLKFVKGPLPRLLKDMQKEKWDIVGTVVNDQRAVQLKDAPFKRMGDHHVDDHRCGNNKVAIIMGSESSGMRTMVKRECTTLVTLPAAPGASTCDSLNVSVTSALVMNHYLQR